MTLTLLGYLMLLIANDYLAMEHPPKPECRTVHRLIDKTINLPTLPFISAKHCKPIGSNGIYDSHKKQIRSIKKASIKDNGLGLDRVNALNDSYTKTIPPKSYKQMTPTWMLYVYAVPMVKSFNIVPHVKNRTIFMYPNMLMQWQEARIENLIIADNRLDFFYRKKGNEVHFEINQIRNDWDIVIFFPKGKFTFWKVNGENNRRSSTDEMEGFKTSGTNIKVMLK
ncbi:hypothetical protein [Anditalea andensis]|uniref:Uncharacterized protein n=1 Tax=Anditalea andensis TaxID=1048983 RepID=A0A074KT23_9BACT|nr:hypothetical protein [Anditalea andensis]KEO72064.1 hypothetical protein EL17_19320 [Anditalea andensis]